MTTHTEEEARTKWCHRDADIGNDSMTCIGSGCMAWQWAGWRCGNNEVVLKVPHGKSQINFPHVGYCGLTKGPSHE